MQMVNDFFDKMSNEEKKEYVEFLRQKANKSNNSGLGYKPLGENLEDGMKGLGNQIRGMPHIILGGKSQGSNPPVLGSPQEVANSPIHTAQTDMFNPKEQKWINLFKKVGLIIAVALVVGYAVWRIFP